MIKANSYARYKTVFWLTLQEEKNQGQRNNDLANYEKNAEKNEDVERNANERKVGKVICVPGGSNRIE